MTSNAQTPGGGPPPKPWERAGSSSSGPTPFKPPSAGHTNTSDVVEASGVAQSGEVVSTANRNTAATMNSVGRPVPPRPWVQQQAYDNNTYGGYGSSMTYNSGYGSGMYGSYGGYGAGSYSGGTYGTNMYRGGYGGVYGGGMYGGGAYGSGYGGPMGGYGMGTGGYGVGMGGPYGDQDPNNPFGPPSSPPGFWISLMRVMQGVVNFFGRFSMLVDQNTQALHMFMSALLQLIDRSGWLYGEIARFVLKILGIKTKSKKVHPPPPGMEGLPGPQKLIEAPKAGPSSGAWDTVWGGDAK